METRVVHVMSNRHRHVVLAKQVLRRVSGAGVPERAVCAYGPNVVQTPIARENYVGSQVNKAEHACTRRLLANTRPSCKRLSTTTGVRDNSFRAIVT